MSFARAGSRSPPKRRFRSWALKEDEEFAWRKSGRPDFPDRATEACDIIAGPGDLRFSK